MLSAAQVLRIVAQSKFRLMDSYDYQGFAGTESMEALIHYADEVGEEYTIILDDEKICVIDLNGQEQQFHLGENIFA